jgi:hypothetical protein
LKNILLKARTRNDIDSQVAKVLRGLGNPEPPLKLEDVRALLKLDKHYYSSTDDGPLQEWISRLKVAGKQVIYRPSLLLDVVKKFDLKALYLPDQKRILLDKEVPEPKHRWNEAHECTHDILPWHKATMLGDTKQTLSLDCHAQIEAEANYAAGRLLFLQEKFDAIARSSKPSIAEARKIGKLFGNTFTSTLWRLVEAQDTHAVGIISCHPQRPGDDLDPANPLRYVIGSPSFNACFSNIAATTLFEALKGYCSYVTKGPLGQGEVMLRDDNGDDHLFVFETFHNSHEALTLGLYTCPNPLTR